MNLCPAGGWPLIRSVGRLRGGPPTLLGPSVTPCRMPMLANVIFKRFKLECCDFRRFMLFFFHLFSTLVVAGSAAGIVALMASLLLWNWLYQRCHGVPHPPQIEIGTQGLKILPLSHLGRGVDSHVVNMESPTHLEAGRVSFCHSLLHQAEDGCSNVAALYDFPGSPLPVKLLPRSQRGHHLPLTMAEALKDAPSQFSIANN
jgi:hypothetical protein